MRQGTLTTCLFVGRPFGNTYRDGDLFGYECVPRNTGSTKRVIWCVKIEKKKFILCSNKRFYVTFTLKVIGL